MSELLSLLKIKSSKKRHDFSLNWGLILEQGKLLDKESGTSLADFSEIIPRLAYTQAGQPFVGMGHYLPNTVLADPDTKYGNPSPCYPFACHIAEVEVDTETGQVEVRT